MRPMKEIPKEQIERAIIMYRKGMPLNVIQFETKMSAGKWKPYLTEEDKQQHDEHNKNNRRIYQNFMISGRL